MLKVQQQPLQTSGGDQFWLKFYTREPFCIYFFGPFKSHRDALLDKEQYLDHLANDGKLVVSYFLIRPIENDIAVNSCTLSHRDWLSSLMQDQLRLTIPHANREAPQVIEPHSMSDPYVIHS